MSPSTAWQKSMYTVTSVVRDAVLFMPKSVAWFLVVWLGTCAALNLGLWFFKPSKYALPYVYNLMEEVHGSALDVKDAQVWVLPWGTVLIQVPQVRWQSSENIPLEESNQLAPLWYVQAEKLQVPIHLWRFLFGGKSALLGTIQSQQAQGAVRDERGLQDFSKVLATFKQPKGAKPSPYTSHIKARVGNLSLRVEDIDAHPSVRSGNYQLNANAARFRFDRDDQRVRLTLKHWKAFRLKDAPMQWPLLIAEGRFNTDLYLKTALTAIPEALPTQASTSSAGYALQAQATDAKPALRVAPLWQALQESGTLRLSVEAHRLNALMRDTALPLDVFSQKAHLDFLWMGKTLLQPARLSMTLRPLNEPLSPSIAEVDGTWKRLNASAKGAVTSGTTKEPVPFVLNKAFVALDSLKLNGEGWIKPTWNSATSLNSAFPLMLWELKAQLNAFAPPANQPNLLNKPLNDAGLSWRSGQLKAHLNASGRGRSIRSGLFRGSTPQPLYVMTTQPLELNDHVAVPRGTQLNNLNLSIHGDTHQLGLRATNAELSVNPSLSPLRLMANTVYDWKKAWRGNVSTPSLPTAQAKAFLAVNNRLVASPYQELIQNQVGGEFTDVRLNFNSFDKSFDVSGVSHLVASHPQVGNQLPLLLQGPLWLNANEMKLGEIPTSARKEPFLLQVANQPKFGGIYTLNFNNQQQGLRVTIPEQSASSIATWANVFGASIPASLKAGDLIGIQQLEGGWDPNSLNRLNVTQGHLVAENAGDATVNANCTTTFCGWDTTGKLNIIPVQERIGLELEGFRLTSGVANWNLSGDAVLGASPRLTRLDGQLNAQRLAVLLQQHPQPIQANEVSFLASGTSWRMNPLQLNWGPLVSDVSGSGSWAGTPHYTLDVAMQPVLLENALAQKGDRSSPKKMAWHTWWGGLGLPLPTRVNPTGEIGLSAKVSDGDISGLLSITEAGVYFPTVMPDPISRVNGSISLDSTHSMFTSEEGLSGYYGLSPWSTDHLKLRLNPNQADVAGRFQLRLHPRELNRIAALTTGQAMTHYNLVGDAVLDARLSLPKWSFSHPASRGQALLSASVQQFDAQTFNTTVLDQYEEHKPVSSSSLEKSPALGIRPKTSEGLPQKDVEGSVPLRLDETVTEASLESFTMRHQLQPFTLGNVDNAPSASPSESETLLASTAGIAKRIPQQGDKTRPEVTPAVVNPVGTTTSLSNEIQAKSAATGFDKIPQIPLAPNASEVPAVAPPSKRDVSNVVLLRALMNMSNGKWQLARGEAYPLGAQQPVFFEANLDSPREATHLFSSKGRIWTPEPIQLPDLHFNGQYPYEAGQFETDVSWKEANGAPSGFIKFWDVLSPTLEINALGGEITLSPTRANVNIERFESSRGSNFSWQAQMLLPQPLPFQFKESRIYSPYWDMNDLMSSMTKQLGFWASPLQESYEVASQWQPEKRISLPLELRNSIVEWDLGVFQNIAVENGEGLLNVYQNGLIQLDDTRFNIVDGRLQMALSLDPFANNALSMKLKADEVPANPVFYGLTGVQQLVLGKLSGNFELSTSGGTNEEFLSNASGKARIHISEGRVPELLAVENILSKVSILRGGLLNLDIGDVTSFLRRRKKSDADISETYDATLYFVNGLMLTKDLRTDGERMDLTVKGSMRLLDGYSNMAIRAEVDTNDSKSLNPWKLSVRKIIQKIPLIGRLPGKEYGLLDYVPVLGYIPAFGFDSGDTVKYYVRVNGQLDDPKDFELPQWVKGQQTFDNWEYTLDPEAPTPPTLMQEDANNSSVSP
jgi:hypothetical protein